MMRLRAIAASLGCLAVLAGSFAAMAEATVTRPAAFERSAVDSEPCSQCDECGDTMCPDPTLACIQAFSTSTPMVVAAVVALPIPGFATVHWAPDGATLNGLSRPPDPFPPRA